MLCLISLLQISLCLCLISLLQIILHALFDYLRFCKLNDQRQFETLICMSTYLYYYKLVYMLRLVAN